jgi:hypothetical protein
MLAAAATVMLCGCGHATTGPMACTALAAPALSVSLVDSLTGATSGFRNVSLVARNGAYTDSVFEAVYPAEPFLGSVSVAYEHRGAYELTILADGYIPWFRSGIVVTGDVCHVRAVSVEAKLQHPIVAGEQRQRLERAAHVVSTGRHTNGRAHGANRDVAAKTVREPARREAGSTGRAQATE